MLNRIYIVIAWVLLCFGVLGQKIDLTPTEQAYLNENPIIYYGYDPTWKPLEFNENGKHVGVSRDYLDILEKGLGIQFKTHEEATTWVDSERLLDEKKLKLLPLIAQNEKRMKTMSFTEVYFTYPYIIATSKDAEFIGGVEDFAGKTVALPSDYAITNKIEEENLDINIIYKASIEECLMAVSTGEADATAGNLCVISYFLNYAGFQNIKIASPTGYLDAEFRMAVNKEDSVLLGILEKGIASVSSKEKNEIVNNWVSVKYEHGVDMAKVWRIAGISAGVVLLFVLFMLYYNRKLKNEILLRKRAEQVLKEQKNLIEEQHMEIKDSIMYAKRIQEAILPSQAMIDASLKQNFVLYLPKDIVAGDFYWLEETAEGEVIFAAADCTGHGVPGAMVSVVCNNAMNRAVREFKLTDPGKILDKTRSLVIEQFEKSNKDVKDGMDIALCAIKGNQLSYAGAHNPLWIIRDGKLIQIKANKEPIGKFAQATNFDTHTMELQTNDMIYVFSDGYADQFGGPKGKKFMTKNMKKLLLSIHDKDLATQKALLEKAFNDWKKDLEQLDDVCVIGVRV